MLPGMPSGQLEKMTISAFKKPNLSTTSKLGKFEVMFNPNQYTQKYEVSLQDRTAPGSNATTQVTNNTPPQEMQFEFLVDGTGAAVSSAVAGLGALQSALNGQENKVKEQVDKFLKLTFQTNSETHQPPYLILNWGILTFNCKLKKADVVYTLFTPDGKPLRAKIQATFIEHVPESVRESRNRLRSPDLTRFREVQEGDKLPLLAFDIYEDSKYYLQLARINGLNHFRKLKTGQSLRMPPLTTEEA